MTNQTQTQAPRRVRPRPRMATVSRVERLTPGCVRVVFSGPELEGYTPKGPAEHIKVLFARPGEAQVTLPEWGPEGPVLQEGQSMPPSRTYTPRAWDASRLELTVDFMLHGAGLASSWAQEAKPGDVLAVSNQPGGPYNIDPAADWYVLAADEAALPGLATILEALPAGKPARAFIEVRDESERLALTSPADVDITWLSRAGDAAIGAGLEQAVRALELPAGEGRVWVGCEAEIMRNIRRHLLDDRSMDRARMHTHGYWKAGASNHPDHDVGQDI